MSNEPRRWTAELGFGQMRSFVYHALEEHGGKGLSHIDLSNMRRYFLDCGRIKGVDRVARLHRLGGGGNLLLLKRFVQEVLGDEVFAHLSRTDDVFDPAREQLKNVLSCWMKQDEPMFEDFNHKDTRGGALERGTYDDVPSLAQAGVRVGPGVDQRSDIVVMDGAGEMPVKLEAGDVYFMDSKAAASMVVPPPPPPGTEHLNCESQERERARLRKAISKGKKIVRNRKKSFVM